MAILSTVCLNAQTVDDIDAAFEDAKRGLDATVKAITDEADAALASYLEFESKLLEEYKQFCEEVMGEWGDSVMVESTRKEWVEYSNDRTSRTSVDWDSGKVAVEVLVDQFDDEATINEKLQAAVGELLTSRGNSNSFGSTVLEDKPISDKPLLEDQIDLGKYGITSYPAYEAPKPFERRPTSALAPTRGGNLNLSRNAGSAVKPSVNTMAAKAAQQQKEEAEVKVAVADVSAAVVAAEKPVIHNVKTTEGTKKVVTITLDLVEDHLPKRAEKFKDMVKTHAAAYAVDAPLIYAIMEQESSFNPVAQSWVPAYGLMQLVPKSGGRDAYRYVHKTDAIPSADFLFDPDNNIQLGTGYLKLLMSTTFKKIEDYRCRMLCAIAAYNTGAGNVSRAINGTTNISKAIPTINTMSYDQLFEHLKKSLPHAETQDYIQKVTSKMEKYIR